MKKNKLTFLFIILILFLYACCRQVPCPDFTEQELAWVPYREADTLVFKNFNNDSVISFHATFYEHSHCYTKSQGTYSCNDGCVAFIHTSIENISAHLFIQYYMQKDKNIAYVFADQYGMSLIHPTEKDRLWFDLNNSLHHDSLIIAGNWMHDVYEYACTDTASAPYKKMFVKNGTGIVRFTLKDNQSFELLKYIKNEKND